MFIGYAPEIEREKSKLFNVTGHLDVTALNFTGKRHDLSLFLMKQFKPYLVFLSRQQT